MVLRKSTLTTVQYHERRKVPVSREKSRKDIQADGLHLGCEKKSARSPAASPEPPGVYEIMQLLVKLKSVDNEVIAVEERVARLSGLINGILTDNDDGIPIGAIPMAETTAHILHLVFLWCEHHKNDPECLQNEYLANLDNQRSLPEWDERLLEDLDNATLGGVISAAEQLKIPKLLYLARRMLRMRSTRGSFMEGNNGPMELEEEDGTGEEAQGHDRGFPILHSQAIEIGHFLR